MAYGAYTKITAVPSAADLLPSDAEAPAQCVLY